LDVFTYANALDQMLKRIRTTDTNDQVAAARGILHGAMALYLTRYLNVPPARIPGERGERSMICPMMLKQFAPLCLTLLTDSARLISRQG
jgi:hypothetical protein